MLVASVTFTGPDESVLPSHLSEIADRCRFVEWGLLVATPFMGKVARFPSLNWMRRLPKTIPLSFHLCGNFSRDFLQGRFTFAEEHPDLFAHAQRVQINFTVRKNDAPNIDGILAIIAKHPETRFIFQVHGRNHEVLDALIAQGASISALYDESGGMGLSPADWKPAYKGAFETGYAGGLKAENVIEELGRIETVAGAINSWVDMESSLRSPDPHTFSLDRCLDTLLAMQPFLLQPESAEDEADAISACSVDGGRLSGVHN